MNKTQKISETTKMALFIAIIVLLAVTPLGYISLGIINATTIQMPVIIGAILFGWKKGAFLGGVFGITSLIKNTVQPNVTSFVFSPFVPVFGEESGVSFTMSISEYPNLKCSDRFFITDNSGGAYNKMYFLACKGAEVKRGDVWHSTTIYNITVK